MVSLDAAVDGRHLDLSAERGLRERHRHLHEHGVAVALEERVRLDKDRDEQIARRPAVQPGVALAAQIQRLPVVDAGRDLDLDGSDSCARRRGRRSADTAGG